VSLANPTPAVLIAVISLERCSLVRVKRSEISNAKGSTRPRKLGIVIKI
jgi:hypothetical protein